MQQNVYSENSINVGVQRNITAQNRVLGWSGAVERISPPSLWQTIDETNVGREVL